MNGRGIYSDRGCMCQKKIIIKCVSSIESYGLDQCGPWPRCYLEKRPAWEVRKTSVWLSVKDEKKNKSWGWRGGESVELPLRSWETIKKMNSPLCFLCTDRNPHPQTSIIQNKRKGWLMRFSSDLQIKETKLFFSLRKAGSLNIKEWPLFSTRQLPTAVPGSLNLSNYNKCTSPLLCGTPI